MTPDSLKNRRLIGIFLLGWVLYNYPIFSLFNVAGTIFGIPVLFAYAFGVWAALIGMVMLVTRFSRPPSARPTRRP
jgi:hypothetical protein